MTADSLSERMLRHSLLEPVESTLHIVRRLQENEVFRDYLRERILSVLPLLVAVIATSVTLAVATAAFVASTNGLVALLVMLTVVPIVLIGSFWVQAHAALSWLEERSLVKLLPGGGRSRGRGPVNQWLVRRVHIDLGPPPQVPWIPALVFFLLPAVVLVEVSPPIAEGLAALLLATAIIYAARDPVIPPDHARPRRERAPTEATPTRSARKSAGAGDLDFTAPPVGSLVGSGLGSRLGSRLNGAAKRARSFVAADFRRINFRIRSLGKLLLVNIPPLVEYAAFGAGLFFAVSGRRSGSGQDLVLGISLIGGALVFAGLASIVTRRMSFRFFLRARSGYAGAIALIAGMMQLVAGGLAFAAAQAMVSGTWDARLQALLTNPWPLLIPLGLLTIGAGLLLMHRPYGHFGAIGVMFYIVPKMLVGAVVFAAGIAILAGWGWKIYDAKAFLGFVHVFLDGNMHHLEKGWHTMIAWLR